MRDPKRILKKILSEGTDLEPFQQSGEPLELLVETLREVQRVRKFRQWLIDQTGIDAALQPAAFHSLLDLPEINTSEESDRNLDVVRHSLTDSRKPEDPVTISNLNTCLREIHKDLSGLNDLKNREYPQLPLASALFPDARRVHPLRKHLNAVQLELAFYHRCLEINIKWAVTGLDLFRVVRADKLAQTIDNLSELGNGLWNLVYNGTQLPTTLGLAGIHFTDITPLFDPEQVPLTVV